MHATPSCCVWAHRTPLYACRPHVLPISMQNARKKNCARFQSVCAAKDSKRTGGHPAFVSQNQTCALAFWALISPYGRFPPMRYHSRDINARQTTNPPHTAVSRPHVFCLLFDDCFQEHRQRGYENRDPKSTRCGARVGGTECNVFTPRPLQGH